jgi:hypothetical protein
MDDAAPTAQQGRSSTAERPVSRRDAGVAAKFTRCLLLALPHLERAIQQVEVEEFKMFAQPRARKTAPPPPKKRKTAHVIEEITFDKDARAEYLTGFHKRKQARIKHAQEIAERKARQDRIEIRKQV